MFVQKPAGERATLRIYGLVLAACCVVLGLAGLLVHFNTVDRAVAQSETRTSGLVRWLRIAALPVERKPVSVAAAKPRIVAQSVVPTLISRAPDDGDTGVVVELTSASPDTDDGLSEEKWAPRRSDTYRTVCVRLCDGAFFPMSFATTRDRFKNDAARCKASCGSPSKLFFGPPDGSMDELTDVKGNAYGDLPNAFKFRASYDAACTCKSKPWEIAELNRHKDLADAVRAAALVPVKPLAQPGEIAKAMPLPGSVSGSLQIAALNPALLPPIVVSRELAGAKAAAASPAGERSIAVSAAAVDVGERRKPAHRAAAGRGTGPGKVAVAAAGKKSPGVKVALNAPKKVDLFRIVFGPKLKQTRPSQVADTSMQRPFKPKEYWRLSYWDVPN